MASRVLDVVMGSLYPVIMMGWQVNFDRDDHNDKIFCAQKQFILRPGYPAKFSASARGVVRCG